MDKKCRHELTKEQRSLLNAGHGPPIHVPALVENSNVGRRSEPLSDAKASNYATEKIPEKPKTTFGFHCASETSPGFFVPSYKLTPGFYYNNHFYPVTLKDEANSRQSSKGTDEQIQRLSHGMKVIEANINSKFDVLQKENEDLKKQLSLSERKLAYIESRYHYLTEQLSTLPDISSDCNTTDNIVRLTTAKDLRVTDFMEEKPADGDDDDMLMMKSVQCSEASIEQVTYNEVDDSKERELFCLPNKKVQHLSSSSSTSFEVVSPEFPNAKLQKRDCELKGSEQSTKNCEPKFLDDGLKIPEKELYTVKQQLHDERIAKLTEKFEQLQEDLRIRSAHFEHMLHEILSQGGNLEAQNLKKKIAELEGELQIKAKMMMDLDKLLKSKDQSLLEAEYKICKFDQLNSGQAVNQQNMAFNQTAVELATENALLKHQIETYKEDFEAVLKDREKQATERDMLRRHYDTLHCDLGVAREQLRRYEDDVSSLRMDNNSLRSKLHEVLEELSALRNQSKFKTVPTAVQSSTIISRPSTLHNTCLPSPLPAVTNQLSDWVCQACTYKNAAPRTFCEMCGTLEPSRLQTSSKVPPRGFLTKESAPVASASPVTYDNLMPQTTPLLSNLRNYGDIETD